MERKEIVKSKSKRNISLTPILDARMHYSAEKDQDVDQKGRIYPKKELKTKFNKKMYLTGTNPPPNPPPVSNTLPTSTPQKSVKFD